MSETNIRFNDMKLSQQLDSSIKEMESVQEVLLTNKLNEDIKKSIIFRLYRNLQNTELSILEYIDNIE